MACIGQVVDGILTAVCGINWAGWGGAAWNAMGLWASTATRYTTTFLAGLLRECYLAGAHATAICTGQDPHYYAVPGFVPIVL
eukprot:2503859-Pyramimonas_sp.AAC.1